MTRVAAVTGGAGAIGGAIVAGLRAAGYEVAILDLNGDPPVDLAERGAVRAGAAAVLDRHGRCDVLVHAAAAEAASPTRSSSAGSPVPKRPVALDEDRGLCLTGNGA
jgi:nucleoside-diphosphate-sugar epimerase